jgi:hypothetical protein
LVAPGVPDQHRRAAILRSCPNRPESASDVDFRYSAFSAYHHDLDETRTLTEMGAVAMQDSRLGSNKQHGLLPLLPAEWNRRWPQRPTTDSAAQAPPAARNVCHDARLLGHLRPVTRVLGPQNCRWRQKGSPRTNCTSCLSCKTYLSRGSSIVRRFVNLRAWLRRARH